MNVDWNRINSFIDTDDEEEQAWLKDMIETLISNYEERLVELEEFTAKNDSAGLISILHQMKGITSNFGLEALRKIISQAESFLKANDLELASKETSKLSPIWIETKSELKAKLGI
jgi:HPt (histidine-containing phosphotransfer) domain-containing protein